MQKRIQVVKVKQKLQKKKLFLPDCVLFRMYGYQSAERDARRTEMVVDDMNDGKNLVGRNWKRMCRVSSVVNHRSRLYSVIIIT